MFCVAVSPSCLLAAHPTSSEYKRRGGRYVEPHQSAAASSARIDRGVVKWNRLSVRKQTGDEPVHFNSRFAFQGKLYQDIGGFIIGHGASKHRLRKRAGFFKG